MASNTPFAVRMEQEDKEKLLKLIEESGKSNKDFMSTLMNAYELNKTKVEIPAIAEDINHLEALTQQINNLYVNVGKRIEDMQKAKDIQFEKDITLHKEKIEALTSKVESLKTEKEELTKKLHESKNMNAELSKQFIQMDETNSANKELIDSLKDKINTLTDIVSEYKGHKSENEEIKKLLADSQSRNIDLNNNLSRGTSEIEQLNKTIDNLKKAHKDELESIKEKHKIELQNAKDKFEIEKQRALIVVQLQHQEKVQKTQEDYAIKVNEYEVKYKELLEELKKGSEFEIKYNSLLEEMKAVKKTNKK